MRRGPPPGRSPTSNPEIDIIRAALAANPRPSGYPERRARMDAFGARYEMLASVTIEPVSAAGVPAEWPKAQRADPSRVLLFLDGGGYVSGSLRSHRHMVPEAGRLGRMRTLALDYRLAPEHLFPAALEDAMAGYRFLLAQGIAPHDIALGGESAGGGLALAVVVSLRDKGASLPACAWLSSLWTDLSQSGGSVTLRARGWLAG